MLLNVHIPCMDLPLEIKRISISDLEHYPTLIYSTYENPLKDIFFMFQWKKLFTKCSNDNHNMLHINNIHVSYYIIKVICKNLLNLNIIKKCYFVHFMSSNFFKNIHILSNKLSRDPTLIIINHIDDAVRLNDISITDQQLIFNKLVQLCNTFYVKIVFNKSQYFLDNQLVKIHRSIVSPPSDEVKIKIIKDIPQDEIFQNMSSGLVDVGLDTADS